MADKADKFDYESNNLRPDQVEKVQTRFMTTTWDKDPSRYLDNFFGWVAWILMYKGPQVPREGKMAFHSPWAQHAFVLPRAVFPLAVNYALMKLLPFTIPWPVAFVGYALYFISFAIMMGLEMNRICEKHGFLDGQAPRDNVPDVRLEWTTLGLLLTVTVRPMLGCFLAYDRYALPALSLWTPANVFVYTCVLDFYFYWYHRAMHEVDFLWKYHKTHHMTKHPSWLLSAFGDTEQDFFDILVIPMVTYLTFPIPFADWWIATVYILYIEAAGHTGARIYWYPAMTGPILRFFDMELLLEDHDLHHRQGWKSSSNYGKQTRIWDKLFGSTRPRIEMTWDAVDFSKEQY